MARSTTTTPLSIPDLPEDVFVLILKYLEPWEVVRCQKVSKEWRATFRDDVYLNIVLKGYPLARETRHLRRQDDAWGSTWFQQPLEIHPAFDRVASRYYHLTQGKARDVKRYKLAAVEQLSHWFPVAQWGEHESQPGGRLYYENATHLSRLGAKPYLFHPTLWSYDDGLLVFAVPEYPGRSSLVLLDVETETMYPIPFDRRNRIIRTLRLRDRTLIVEWAERVPFHDLNASEKVHRHFASCYDVHHSDSEWTVTFRSEWKIHFLGLPLNQRDRFFSTHTAQHYAIYFWQPNRSMYTGDEDHPIETLFVWDISVPSSDRPHTHRPSTPPLSGPHIVSRYSYHYLSHLGIRQRSTIALTSLHLDSHSSTLTIRENTSLAGQGYFDPSQRLWCAKTTTFPFLGHGPHLCREWDGNLPPYRGHCTMDSCDVQEAERWFVPIMDVYDDTAGVRYSLVETCLTGSTVKNELVLRVTTGEEGSVVAMEDELVREVASMGRIAGDERWLIGQNGGLELVVLKF